MMKIKTVAQEPCGQHTVWEPQCETCARLAGLEKERDEALAHRDRLKEVMADVACYAHGMGQRSEAMSYPLTIVTEFEPAIEALDNARVAWSLAEEFGSPEERAKTKAEYSRAREYLISLCQAALDRKR